MTRMYCVLYNVHVHRKTHVQYEGLGMGDPIKTQAKITDSNTATSYTGPEKTFTINMAPSKSKHAGGGKNNVYLTEKHLLGFDKYKVTCEVLSMHKLC